MQLFNAYLLWAERDVDLQLLGYRIPTSWLIGMDAFLGLCVLAASIPAWHAIERRYGDFPLMRRLVIASFFVCAGAAALVLAVLIRGEAKIALFWPILFQLFNSIGLAQILPGVVALLGGSREGRASATALSFYFVGLFVASLGSTLLAAQFGNMEVWLFWTLHFGCTLAGAMIFVILNSKRKNSVGET